MRSANKNSHQYVDKKANETSLITSASVYERLSSGSIPKAGPSKLMPRAPSLYGTPALAQSEDVNTHGSSTYDYDIESNLRKQQARRRRGNSNGSISTTASVLSNTPSVVSHYAQGEFVQSSAYSLREDNTKAYDAKDPQYSRSRTSSIQSSASIRSLLDGRPSAPTLTDTLEQLIANSTSYRAVNPQPHINRRGVPTSASVRNLTSFTPTLHRQMASGILYNDADSKRRTTSLFSFGGAQRAPTKATHMAQATLGKADQSVTARGHSTSVKQSEIMGSVHGLRHVLAKDAALSKKTSSYLPQPKSDTLSTSLSAKKKGKRRAADALPPLSPVPSIRSNQRSFENVDPTSPTSTTAAGSHTHSLAGSRASSSVNLHALTHGEAGSCGSQSPKRRLGLRVSLPLQETLPKLDKELARVEDQSGLRTSSRCDLCHKSVVNAPLTRSGKVYCGRACRMESRENRQITSPPMVTSEH